MTHSWKFYFSAMLLMLWTIGAPAQTLERLETILSRYASLSEFLADEKGLDEYKQAYAEFIGDTTPAGSAESFDAVWSKFLGQLREVNEKIPEFGPQVWRVNPKWRESEFELKGEAKGSGLIARREVVLEKVENARAEATQVSASLWAMEGPERKVEVERLISELRGKYGLLSTEQIKRLSRAEAKAYSIRIGGDRKRGLPGLADETSAKVLAAFFTAFFMTDNEDLRDFIFSGDADMTYEGIGRLARLESFADEDLASVREILPYLKHSAPALTELQNDYERGLLSMQRFRQIKEPRPTEELRNRLAELAGQDVALGQQYDRLSDPLKRSYHLWQAELRDARNRKQATVAEFKSPSFHYQTWEDPVRGTLRLQADASMALTYIASPRPFHLLLAGRRNRECVGGGNCDHLVVKRWARGALKGDRSLFSLQPDGTMEGFIGLTQVANKKDPVPSWILDLGSRATKGEIILKNSEGRPIKYTFFDALIDKLTESAPGEKPTRFIISDGNSVSANVAGAELVHRSQAYNERKVIGSPADFDPVDPMAARIAERFPDTVHGYGSGGLIYDGMKDDGHFVYDLAPRSARRRWTKDKLEFALYLHGLAHTKAEEWIWTNGFESGVRLESARHYQSSENIRRFLEQHAREFVQRFRDGSSAEGLAAAVDRVAELAPHAAPTLALKLTSDWPELKEILTEKAGLHAGSEMAQQILEMPDLYSEPSEKLVQALVKNLGDEIPDSVRETVMRKLILLAGHPDSFPRLADEDVTNAVIRTLKSEVSNPAQLNFPGYHAALFLKLAMEFHPEEKRLVSETVLKEITDALTQITSGFLRGAGNERHRFIHSLFTLLSTAIQMNPELEAPVSQANVDSAERFLGIHDSSPHMRFSSDSGLGHYANTAVAFHPQNERLRSSPLLSLLVGDELTPALIQYPTEPRLQVPSVWRHLLERLSYPGDPALKVFEALSVLAKENPTSGVFREAEMLPVLLRSRSPQALPAVVQVVRQNPGNPNLRNTDFIRLAFFHVDRELVRAILDGYPEQAENFRRYVYIGINETSAPEFFRWLEKELDSREGKDPDCGARLGKL